MMTFITSKGLMLFWVQATELMVMAWHQQRYSKCSQQHHNRTQTSSWFPGQFMMLIMAKSWALVLTWLKTTQ